MVAADAQQAEQAADGASARADARGSDISDNAVESALSMLGSPGGRGVPARRTGHQFHARRQQPILGSKPRTKEEVYAREHREQEKLEKAFLLDMRSEWLVAFLEATHAEAKDQVRASADTEEETSDEAIERLQAEGTRWSSFLVELEKERARFSEFA